MSNAGCAQISRLRDMRVGERKHDEGRDKKRGEAISGRIRLLTEKESKELEQDVDAMESLIHSLGIERVIRWS